jgi:DNA polymerase-3 subunit gamma/tau
MLSTAAFNALLKTLEEPPAHVKFMFATTDPEKVLPTILSRCQRFDLRRIPAALITKHLAHIAKLEKVKIDEAALHAIARGADGAMRDAESTLDQLISFCGDKIEEADVLSMFGLAAQSQILGLSRAVLAGEIQTALSRLNELAQNGKDLGRLLTDLLNHFRNLLIFQVSRGDLNLLEVSEAEVAALKEQSGLANTESLTRILEVLTDSELRLRDTASRKILLEVAMLKAIEARNAISLDSVLKQLNQLRGPGGAGVPAVPKHSEGGPPAPTTVTANVSSRPASKPASEITGVAAQKNPPAAKSAVLAEAPPGSADLAGLWAKLVEAVGRVSPFTRSYLVDAQPVLFEKNILTIGFDPEFEDHLGLVDNARNHMLLQTKLAELGHANAQIKFVKIEASAARAPQPAKIASPALAAPKRPVSPERGGGGTEGGAPASSTSVAKEKAVSVSFNENDFKNDPLIQKALEIFKGQIVEVRA